MKTFTAEEYAQAVEYLRSKTSNTFSFLKYCKQNKISKLDGIILFTHIIVTIYCRANYIHHVLQVTSFPWPFEYDKTVLEGENFPWGSVVYPENIIPATIFRTIAAVLSAWLENDQEHTQTLNSFVTQITKVREYELMSQNKKGEEKTKSKKKRRSTDLPPEKYLSRSEQQTKIVASDNSEDISNNKSETVLRDEKIYKAYRRAEAIFVDMQKLQEAQAHEIGRMSTRLCFQKTTEKTTTKYYNFPTLCMFQLLASGHSNDSGSNGSTDTKFLSPLFDMLVYRKKTMQVAKDSTRLVAAYDCFNKMIAHFKKTPSNREYVAFCMTFMKIEYAFRFQLIAELAVYQQKNNKPIDEKLPDLAGLFWYRRKSIPEQLDILGYLDEEVDGYRYPGQISKLYAEGDDVFTIAEQAYAMRELFSNVQSIVSATLRPEKMGPWSDSDFKMAADFFKNYYPVIEKYEPVKIGGDETQQKQLCQRLTHLYNSITGEVVEDFRESMQTKKRKRRAKSTAKNTVDPPG